jgi:glycosyltransferase involved in cell wall biosynthesis
MRRIDELTMGSQSNGRFVVGFAGARDSYQVALALTEANLLDVLLTDLYLPKSIAVTLERTGLIRAPSPRYVEGINWHSVRTSYRAFLSDKLSAHLDRFGVSAKPGQQVLAELIARYMEDHDRHALIYAGYAFEAFTSKSMGLNQKKILFQYHPFRQLDLEILAADASKWPEFHHLVEVYHKAEPDLRNERELRHSDSIICASDFTKVSLEKIGLSSEKIHVIPYGIDIDACAMHYKSTESDRVRFLYVGSGIHRKGLHVLLRAWNAANLSNAELVVVTRGIAPAIASVLATTKGNVKILSNLSKTQLRGLYLASDIFVLPSLVEGFGYVILEALAHGCFVIATKNTCLPGLGVSDEVCSIVTAGDEIGLEASLVTARNRIRRDFDRERSIFEVSRLTWSSFRKRINSVVRALSSSM